MPLSDVDIYAEPDPLDHDVLANLGPLAPLVGTWESAQGVDIAPCREGSKETPYRERLVLDPLSPVVNGPQALYGLRYATTAWPLGEKEPFHEEVGYWLWCPVSGLVMRDFIVPRGVTVSAGAYTKPDARHFRMEAELGSDTFGIASNPFLNEAFRTVKYEVEITVHDDGSFSYAEDTVLAIRGRDEPFHHKDTNTLHRV